MPCVLVCVCECVLTSRIPSASITMVQVPGLRTNGSTKLFWGTLTKVGSELGANTICLDCSEPAEHARTHTLAQNDFDYIWRRLYIYNVFINRFWAQGYMLENVNIFQCVLLRDIMDETDCVAVGILK